MNNITEDEVIAVFLKGEISSKRFRADVLNALNTLGHDESIILSPDTTDSVENHKRKQIFAAFRGYGENRELFENFPANVRWVRASLTKAELLEVKYINYSFWNALSENTRLPTVAARNINRGHEAFNISNKNFLDAADALRDGKEFSELILVAKNEHSPLVALEGSVRLTAYALAQECVPEEIQVIIGFSEDIEKWGEYLDVPSGEIVITKDLDKWNGTKKDIEFNRKGELAFHEREIWWCSIGLNVGDEQDGKNMLFERPVLVIKKFNNRIAWVVPLSTNGKEGLYYHKLTHDGKDSTVILSQIRLISVKRFQRFIRKISPHQFEKIKAKLVRFLK